MALSVEASELVELFQWLTPDESVEAPSERGFGDSVAEELADILIYAIRLADVANVDLTVAVPRKIEKNALKHPASK